MSAPQQTNDVALADFNHDGKIDLVYSSPSGISIALGNGDGTFGAVQNISTSSSYDQLAVADFNSDGVPDILASIGVPGTLYLFAGHGDGTFAAPTAIAVPQGPRVMLLGDFNGDKKMDIAVAATLNAAIYILDALHFWQCYGIGLGGFER
jgi:hypothetical protein